MKKSTQNIKTLCLHCFIILLFFAGTLGTVSATAKADEPVEEQTINIDVPKKLDQGVSNSANLAVRDMQVEKETNSAFLSKNIIPQFDNTVQELNCIPNGGSMWVNGPFMPEIAAEIQQDLVQLGINSVVEARSYGEIDNCGTYLHQGVDFTITLQKAQLSIQSINQEVITNDILPILITFGKPNLGNVTLVDSQGKKPHKHI
ncbi:MAG: hypothetical protein IPP99_05900 [Chitinophagaceae bacterium]|nr:hypothetical protein [Chitinophagaceae bacterium]